jgi:Protein of unknown function (DUF4197)
MISRRGVSRDSREARMKTFRGSVLLLFICTAAWPASLRDLTNADASSGLRQALTQGANQAVSSLGKKDGFLLNSEVRIPLPPRLAKAEKVMRMAGMGAQADDLVLAMNRAAEAAVPEAKPLLLDAVKSMSVADAKRILTGGDDSVTQFFKAKTSDALMLKFMPIVQKYTANADLAKKYKKFAGAGLQMGLIKKEDADVDSYVARSALDGVYKIIGQEEKAIRANPAKAVGSLAKKVFGALGK